MDIVPFNCVTPEVRRHITFLRRPLPNDRKFSISNSPAKFARAGFIRCENAQSDEVTCETCKITYSNWEGESPFAVHIVLNEQCPFLSTPSADDMIQRHPLVDDARRRWFPVRVDDQDDQNDSGYDSRLENSLQSPEQASVSVLSTEATFTFPFQPKVGGVSMLFASRRLKTFTDSGCRLCVKWAEEGFVFKQNSSEVQCVFCAIVFPFDSFDVQQMHAENSVLCPHVLMKDVGNVTRAEEERIRFKHLQQQLTIRDSQQWFAVFHPQYEEENHRVGTFENWPHESWDDQLQPSVMSEAGFYFTGCADKVKCYCCGLGLHKWKQGSKPWEQHALHMPACPLVQAKGQDFVQQAAQAQVLTEADFPPSVGSQESSNGTGQLVTSTPGSLTMDMSAVTAALSTSRFPTKDILIGQLRANDVNFSDLCKQRDVNHQQSTQLQQKDTQIQQQSTQLEEHVGIVQQQNQVINHKDQVIQRKDQVIQHKDQVIQERDEELECQREALHQKEVELQRQMAEVERRKRLMAYQEQQISSLQIQMQALLAERRRQAGQHAPPFQAANNNAAAAAAAAQNNPMTCDIRCKVCLSAESNTIFQPCHHITCCKTCAEHLVSEFCPVCRAPIRDVLPAYIS